MKHKIHPIVEIPLSLGAVGALLVPHLAAIKVIEFLEHHDAPWIGKLYHSIQNWRHTLPDQPRQPHRTSKGILARRWLGHSLHPVLSDVPLSAWTGTMLLDLVWLKQGDERVAHGADVTCVLGLLGATGASVTGVTDWNDLNGVARRVGVLHGLLNSIALLTNFISLILRLTGKRRAGIALSATGYVTSLFSAYLGGELVFLIPPSPTRGDPRVPTPHHSTPAPTERRSFPPYSTQFDRKGISGETANL